MKTFNINVNRFIPNSDDDITRKIKIEQLRRATEKEIINALKDNKLIDFNFDSVKSKELDYGIMYNYNIKFTISKYKNESTILSYIKKYKGTKSKKIKYKTIHGLFDYLRGMFNDIIKINKEYIE